MKFRVNLKKLYDAGIRNLAYGGIIDSCTYDAVSSLGGVLLKNGEIVETYESMYESGSFGVGGIAVKPNGKHMFVFSRKEFRILTKNVSEET